MAASASTCAPWATDEDVCAPCAGMLDADPATLDPADLAAGLQIASDYLWNLTGWRWPGECTEVIRPTACGCAARTGWWLPPSVHMPSVSLSDVGELGALCGCGSLGVSEVKLPGYPAVAITEVIIDGVVVGPSQYRIDQRRLLVYQGATRSGWPCCQRLDLPAGAPGTWSVEYTFGAPPPPGGVRAAASLGCQLALACSPDDTVAAKCRLPKRVTSITRQGVTVAILDPLTLFKDGQTGLPEVDMWVASVTLGAARRRATAWVPGRHQASRRTTTP